MIDRTVRLQVTAAVAWSGALIPAALLLPIANPQRSASQLRSQSVQRWISLTQNNGLGILWIPIVALVLALTVAYLLGRQYRSDRLGSSLVATAVGVVVLLGAITGAVTFLIGVALAPTAILILLASSGSRRDARLRSTWRSQVAAEATCACGRENETSARYCPSCGEPGRRSDRSTT